MAHFYQPRGRQPFMRLPAALIAVLAALVAAHAARVWAPLQVSVEMLAYGAFIPARYDAAFLAAHSINAGTPLQQVLPFLGYIFLHANWQHLAVNCIWLIPFGAVIGRRFGSLLFILLFLLCGVAGAVVHLACNWGSEAPVIGASAAVSGIMAAAFRAMNDPPGAPLAPLFSRRILIWSAVWTVANVVAGVTGLGAGEGVRLIAWQAHLGGYFAGLLLAGPFDALHRAVIGRSRRRLNGGASPLDANRTTGGRE